MCLKVSSKWYLFIQKKNIQYMKQKFHNEALAYVYQSYKIIFVVSHMCKKKEYIYEAIHKGVELFYNVIKILIANNN